MFSSLKHTFINNTYYIITTELLALSLLLGHLLQNKSHKFTTLKTISAATNATTIYCYRNNQTQWQLT